MVSMMLQRSEFLRGIVQGVGKGDKTMMVVSLLGVKLYEGVEMTLSGYLSMLGQLRI